MASPIYHTGPRGVPGYEVALTSASGVVNRTVIPAFVQVDETGAAATPGGPLSAGTDRSGTAGTSATTLAPANTARRGLTLQNISANNIGINEVGGAAAIGTAGTYTVPAGGQYKASTNRALSIIASAASSAYTATEF